ncbi:hypothetical protein ACFY1L_14905 [Streptomyces sp. NPDC001663]|uniref:hypothetical protein n=1 Tax=Streptomyces sp. NPDC001663 TaxID=3364597 RepID=UPI0036AB8C7B
MPYGSCSTTRRCACRSRRRRARAAGNLQVDHILPSKGLTPGANGLFWPTSDDPPYRLVGDGKTVVTSDHRMVWQEVRVG